MAEFSKVCPEWSTRTWHTLDYDAGRALLRNEVKNLERILSNNTTDTTARILLLGYYAGESVSGLYAKGKARDSYLEHLLWFIDNEPSHPELVHAGVPPGAVGFDVVRSHWRKAIRKNENSVPALVNAAHFFAIHSLRTTENLWKTILRLDPDQEEWHRTLSWLYRLHAHDTKSPGHRRLAKKGMEHFRTALELHSKFPQRSYLHYQMRSELAQVRECAILFGLSEDAQFFEHLLAQWKNSQSSG